MAPRRLIIAATIANLVVFLYVAIAVFGGWPAWPVAFWIVASHLAFCWLVLRFRRPPESSFDPLVSGLGRPR